MPANDLDLELVRCFLAVAEARNFTAAARKLSRTQSAVSMRISRLEEVVGHRLLERNSRSVALTDAGASFLVHASRLLALNDETLDAMRSDAPASRLRVGILEYLAPQQLPAMLAAFRRKSTRLHLTVRLGLSRALLDALDADELDVAVAKVEAGRKDGRRLWREQMLWVGAEAGDSVRPARVPLLLLLAPCSYRTAALEGLARKRVPWDEVLTTTSIHGVQDGVRSGLGYAVLGRSALQPGMQVMRTADGWPPLPALGLAAYGQPGALDLAQPLLDGLRSTDS